MYFHCSIDAIKKLTLIGRCMDNDDDKLYNINLNITVTITVLVSSSISLYSDVTP
jgi:hypothetical protein